MTSQTIDSKAMLHNNVQVPRFGLGLFQNTTPEDLKKSFHTAWETGYRLFDTASVYRNEKILGQILRDAEIDRQALFLTSKVWNSNQGFESTLKAFRISLKDLGVSYLDLYLVHWPVNEKFVETWKALEQLYTDGYVRAIGVSNFLRHHLDVLLDKATVKPMVNQIEYHPWLTQPELIAYHRKLNIQVQGWAPLMRGEIFNIELIKNIGRKHHKSPVQIVLRWHLQNNILVIPKSARPERIIQNATIFDFELSDDEMKMINALNKGTRLGPDPDNFSF